MPPITPPLPDIALIQLEDLSPSESGGFLRLVRRRLCVRRPDGSRSPPFVYDEVDRHALDAVVMVAHFRDREHGWMVYLRSALRPPVVFREAARSPIADRDPRGSIWELPAGLVEPGEESAEGIRRAASRELLEELGFSILPEALKLLGESTFPAPGFTAERHHYFEVAVEPEAREEPGLDGSALEEGGAVAAVPLTFALQMCRDGQIVDAKTELGLRRLKERAG